MLRSKKALPPCLLALLSLMGLILALTNTNIGPYSYHVRGHVAPWYSGALVTILAFFACLVSLWWAYFPEWERRHALSKTVETVEGRRVPVLLFPYSSGPNIYIAMTSVLIVGLSSINNLFYLALLVVPILALTFRAAFGQQFVGVSPEGLLWRVMPTGASQGGSNLRGNEAFRRQPVQFLPWSAISEVSWANIVPASLNGQAVSRSAATSLMLQISLLNREALASLTHYQRIIATETGADVFIPLAQMGPKTLDALIKTEQIRAKPEAVWEAADHYLRHPEERGQIGLPLAEAHWREAACVPDLSARLPKKMPSSQVLPNTLGQDARDAAQRVGGKAAKAGAVVNALLGLPYFLTLFILHFTVHISDHDRWFLPVTAGYLLLIVLPSAVAFCSALAAFAAPQGQEKSYARAIWQEAVTGIAVLSLLVLSLSAYQYFDPANPGTTVISLPETLTAITLAVAGIYLGSVVGVRVGKMANMTGPAWLTQMFGLCAKWFL